jgi:glycosyltransferase involved in cell wall biosynthesis
MTRILFIVPTLDRGGAEKQLYLLATRLPRPEFDVAVCALTRGGPFESDLRAAGVPVHVVGKRLKVDPVAAWRLHRLIRRGGYDIVHTWLFAANSYGRWLARRAGVPIVVASERCADHWKGSAELIIDRWLARRTDCIVVNSQAVAGFYERAGIAREKLCVIPNGIALDAPPVVDRAAVLAELGIPSSAPVMGFVGRLWPQKRVQDFIWAADIIKNVKPDVYSLIVGDGPLRERLHQYAADVQMLDRVKFLGDRPDVPRLLCVMDFLVLPSEFEGMPNVVLEAMWAGRPVVATRIPGTDEVVQDGETGLLVPVGDRAELARRCNQLLEDPTLRERMGTAGRRRVAAEFGVDRMVQAHAELYRKWVDSTRLLSPGDFP